MTISERLSDYSTIIPQMELDSLANTAKRKFEASRDAALARM